MSDIDFAATPPHIAVVGMGVMGSALALNMADHGFAVAVTDLSADAVEKAVAQADGLSGTLVGAHSLEELVAAMAPPRSIILLIPAGDAVDAVSRQLRPMLDKGDLIVDAGNANFRHTVERARKAHAEDALFMGIGISGGAEGARTGPSIMVGGDERAWTMLRPVLEAISAKHGDEPCAARLGPNGAGHFIKTVHNGIEYADMEMIAEIYGLMRDGMGMDEPDAGAIFARWNEGPLESYLIEITAKIAASSDPKTGEPTLDVIVDSAGQKGTGRWTAIEALHLGVPVTAIDAAVAARNISARREERRRGEDLFGSAPQTLGDEAPGTDVMEKALLAGKIAAYAQGFTMIQAASAEYEWDVPLGDVARIWRAGCIIRSAMLDDMADALTKEPGTNLMFLDPFAGRLRDTHDCLRQVVAVATRHGHPVPALSAALAYFDLMRTARGTANMIQAQRDFFGAHSFRRIDEEGAFHGPWHA